MYSRDELYGDDVTSGVRVSSGDLERMREHRERVEREMREEKEARLHGQLHDTIDSPDECERCAIERLNIEGDPTRNGAFR